MARFAAIVASATTLLSSATAATTQFVMYTPGGDDTVVERIDPITNPGTFSGHVHQIFGANALSPNMTYDSLQQSDCTTVGNAAGEGNLADKSVYWHPSLYAEAATGSGYVRIPTNGHKMYYRDVGNDADQKADPFEFPHGFRMVAGDMTMRGPNSDSSHQGITDWQCHTSGGSNVGEQGGFPKGISDCEAYPFFAGSIHFPHCWNGNDFDQSDPTAHMSYPEGDVQGGPCPSSHPIRLPHIFQENFFDLHSVVDKVKPNSFVLSQGDNTGFGWHADMFNGWDDGAIPALLGSCPEEYYGNEDVGACSAFQASTSASECKLQNTFTENVDDPSGALPGCNPITDVNPAPKLVAAAIGDAITSCAAAGGIPAPYVSASASLGTDAPASSSAVAYQPPTPTTLVTAAAAAVSSFVAPVVSDNVVVWVTELATVTVIARNAEATPPPKIRRRSSRIMRNY